MRSNEEQHLLLFVETRRCLSLTAYQVSRTDTNGPVKCTFVSRLLPIMLRQTLNMCLGATEKSGRASCEHAGGLRRNKHLPSDMSAGESIQLDR